METYEINIGVTYTANPWKGDRKVTDLKRHRGQDAVVHYLDLRTQRTGNAPLRHLAAGAEVVVQPQTEVGEAGAFAIKVVHSDFWIDCCDTVEHAQARARDLGLCVVDL